MKVAGDSLGSDGSSMHDAQWDEGLTSIRLWNFSFSWQIPLGKLKKIEFHKNVSELLFLDWQPLSVSQRLWHSSVCCG